MKPILFHALLTLDPSAGPAGDAPGATRTGVIHAGGDTPDGERRFPALVETADNEPFRAGEDAREVTISVTDEVAPDYLITGAGFELWSGEEAVGRGVITRRAFV
jgi:hypothetical protein